MTTPTTVENTTSAVIPPFTLDPEQILEKDQAPPPEPVKVEVKQDGVLDDSHYIELLLVDVVNTRGIKYDRKGMEKMFDSLRETQAVPVMVQNDKMNRKDVGFIFKNKSLFYDKVKGLLYARIPNKIAQYAPNHYAMPTVYIVKSVEKTSGRVLPGGMIDRYVLIYEFKLVEIALRDKEHSSFKELSCKLGAPKKEITI